MDIKEKIALLEEAMDLDEGTLTLESQLEDFEEWDSLSKLSLIATAKKEFDIALSADIIRSFKTVKDVCDSLF